MHKLKKRAQFQKVYKRGNLFNENHIRLSLLANGLGQNRLGISISSKKTPLSVNRNRSKRLLSESYRLTEELLKPGYDIILIPNKDISNLTLGKVKDEIIGLYKKSGILK